MQPLYKGPGLTAPGARIDLPPGAAQTGVHGHSIATAQGRQPGRLARAAGCQREANSARPGAAARGQPLDADLHAIQGAARGRPLLDQTRNPAGDGERAPNTVLR